MFARIAAFATFAIPLVSALTLNTPTGASNGGSLNVTWGATTSDPSSFSLYMVNTIFHNTFAIANNVQASAGWHDYYASRRPLLGWLTSWQYSDGYTLEATSNSNITDVYATSGDFAVTAATTSSTSVSSTTSTSTSTSLSGSSGTASTVSPTGTTPATTSSSSGTSTPSTINSGGATSLKIGMGPVAVVLLSAAAGAAIMF
ncbi:hypothetical protein DFJ58DRAFT_730596 [Suillus subalutaceus]|uniref:uncharacterized protein n=1 Tax=Suillus subalutaceus TaxID=48586 RepID=UPI001B87666E|nr:uncharacterized protein DFJ58DRAFT_730596 [Suillus subalutaceus]KAG1846209.1 hypothetical protein DFJ58DRAFT_730596 [Suillus subalutaceus]